MHGAIFEGFEGAVEGAGVAGLVAVEGGEDAGLVAQGAEGQGGAGLVGADFEFLLDPGFLAGHFEIEEGGFEGGGAVHAPLGGDELEDEGVVNDVGGLEVGEVGVAEGVEVVFGFGLENDGGAGGEAVGEGGVAAAGEALGGDGPVGASAIGAGRGDAALRRHGNLLGARVVRADVGRITRGCAAGRGFGGVSG